MSIITIDYLSLRPVNAEFAISSSKCPFQPFKVGSHFGGNCWWWSANNSFYCSCILSLMMTWSTWFVSRDYLPLSCGIFVHKNVFNASKGHVVRTVSSQQTFLNKQECIMYSVGRWRGGWHSRILDHEGHDLIRRRWNSRSIVCMSSEST